MPPSVPKPDEAAVPLDPAARQGDEDAGPAQDVGTKDAPTPTSALYTVVQTLPMLVLAVVGLLLSGRELDLDKFMILVPIMMNLKGNLELNLSLRMSTAANMGELDNRRTRQVLVRGNLALLQAQALIVAFAAGIMSFAMGHEWRSPTNVLEGAATSGNTTAVANTPMPTPRAVLAIRGIHAPGRPNVDRALRLRNGYLEFFMIVAVSMMSASLSSAIQGTCVAALVIWARRFRFDPDTMVVPIAGSLGDLMTLTVLGLLAAGMLPSEGSPLSLILFVLLILVCCVMVFLTLRNVYVRELFGYGWTPLFAAAAISSVAGVLLDRNAAKYDGLALLAPVVSGLPGVSAAVLTSTITSGLHAGHIRAPTRSVGAAYAPLDAAHRPGYPSTHTPGRFTPLCGWKLPLTLLASTMLVQAGFLLVLWLTRSLVFGWIFAVCFLLLSAVLSCTALALGYALCLLLWYFDYDPDSSCMPYLTSLVDALSQLVLLGAFAAAHALGDRVHT